MPVGKLSKELHLTPNPSPKGNKCAFTLAEVLITLVIIGVIAAITVPTLITKYQKEQTVTRLKKAYSSLAQTRDRAIADYGPVNTWSLGIVNNSDDTINFLNKYVVPYMNVMKPPTTKNTGHWNATYYNLKGDKSTMGSKWARFYLNDGTSISCHINISNEKLLCFIDVNGDKNPNKQGKDIFEIDYYISSGLRPWGIWLTREQLVSSQNQLHTCNKNCSGSGCAALIMKDGWRIADDYPW